MNIRRCPSRSSAGRSNAATRRPRAPGVPSTGMRAFRFVVEETAEGSPSAESDAEDPRPSKAGPRWARRLPPLLQNGHRQNPLTTTHRGRQPASQRSSAPVVPPGTAPRLRSDRDRRTQNREASASLRPGGPIRVTRMSGCDRGIALAMVEERSGSPRDHTSSPRRTRSRCRPSRPRRRPRSGQARVLWFQVVVRPSQLRRPLPGSTDQSPLPGHVGAVLRRRAHHSSSHSTRPDRASPTTLAIRSGAGPLGAQWTVALSLGAFNTPSAPDR